MALQDYPVNRVIASGDGFDGLIAGVVRASGAEPVWLLCNAYPVRDGSAELDQVVVMFIDITAIIQAESEVRASERKFRGTVESLEEGYYSVTEDGTILDHNPAFCRILGMDEASDMRGQGTPDFWSSGADRTAYLRLLTEEGHVRGYLARAKRADGSRIVVLLNAHFVRDDTGDIERIEGTVLDITARKAAEDEVERLNAELEQRVARAHRAARGRQQGAGGVLLLRLARPARAAARTSAASPSCWPSASAGPAGRAGAALPRDHLRVRAADGRADRRPARVLAHGPRRAAASRRSTWTRRSCEALEPLSARDRRHATWSGPSGRCRRWSATARCCARCGRTCSATR